MVFLWWWCGGVVVSTSGSRTRTFRCFARLWRCGGVVVWCCFCGGVFCGGVFMVVFLVFLWWCFYGGTSWCQHPARELVLFGVLQDCGFGLGVFGVFVVVFLKWSGGVFV